MSGKQKWPLEVAKTLAENLVSEMLPFCERVLICGSIRRKRPMVGDIEIVFIPKTESLPSTDMFAAGPEIPATDILFHDWIGRGVIGKRKNTLGSTMWGASNKLAFHVETGIALDLFATTETAWWNYVVCRTGGAESNKAVAMAAIRKGWKWNPTGDGFSRPGQGVFIVCSERDVFEFVGMEYLQPEERR